MDSIENQTLLHSQMHKVCYEIPKAELHIHIEGTFEPELMFEIAKRNNIKIPFNSVEEVREKYQFNNLQEFLYIYYAACDVLLYETDFEDLAYAYLKKSSTQGLKYAEIFFDPQTHTKRGVKFSTVIRGLKAGLNKGLKEFGIQTNLIMCFLRDLSEEDAFNTLEEAMSFKEDILAVGLDSYEIGNPPEKFKNVFNLVKESGFRITAHAAEEDHAFNIKSAIDVIHSERIDHGVKIIEDKELMKEMAEKRIPFTLCPFSNYRLKCIPDLTKYPLREFLNAGMLVMLNSDDPAYFGGYVGDNYLALYNHLNLSFSEISLLAANSFRATFLKKETKDNYIKDVENYTNSFKKFDN